jgi:hypothetical protein
MARVLVVDDDKTVGEVVREPAPRVSSVGGRTRAPAATRRLVDGHLGVDVAARVASVGAVPLSLTARDRWEESS